MTLGIKSQKLVLPFLIAVFIGFSFSISFAPSVDAACTAQWECKDSYNEGYKFSDCAWWTGSGTYNGRYYTNGKYYCRYGCQNGQYGSICNYCTSPNWKCVDSKNIGYQFGDCSWWTGSDTYNNKYFQNGKYYCQYGCSNGDCNPPPKPSCSAGWVCVDSNSREYVNSDCSRTGGQSCGFGCSGGSCNSVPQPSKVSINAPSEMIFGNTITVTISYKNNGGYAPKAYISPSFSNDWEVVDYYGDGGLNKQLFSKGSSIATSSGSSKPADYTLIDFWTGWYNGETRTATIKLKPKTTGNLFFNVRAAFCNDNWSTCLRDPNSGSIDQQGWNVYYQTINVKPSCTAGNKCINSNSAGYQNSDCSWTGQMSCGYGCNSGTGSCNPSSCVYADGTTYANIGTKLCNGNTAYLCSSSGWSSALCGFGCSGGSCNPTPVPTKVSIDYPSEIYSDGTAVVTIKYRNDGGYAPISYLSPSFSNDWEIISHSSDLPSNQLFVKGNSITTSSGSSKLADYTLIDFWGSWSNSQTKTTIITLRPKITGNLFFNVRTAFCNDGLSICYRDPTSGSSDQQGWNAYYQTINVKQATYTARAYTNTQYTDIYIGNSWKCNTGTNRYCDISGLTGTVTAVAKKLGYYDTSTQTTPSSKEFNFNMGQLFTASLSLSKSTVNSGETFSIKTKVNNVYMKDIGWGNYEGKVKMSSYTTPSGGGGGYGLTVIESTYENTYTTSCNILFTCLFVGIWNYFTGGWEISQDMSFSNAGSRSIFTSIQDVYAGTSVSNSAVVSVVEPTYTVTVKTNVNSDIYRDSSKICSGVQTCTQTLKAGTYTFKAISQGYIDKSEAIGITGDKTISWDLQKATYQITAKTNVEGTDIYLDNTKKCTTVKNWFWETPWCQFTVNTGKYQLKISKAGYVADPQEVSGPPDQEKYFTLTEAQYTATIYTNMQYADIYIGSVYKCNTGTNKYCQISGLTGSVTVTAKKSGYYDKSATVDYSNQLNTINLEQSTYKIIAKTNIPGADISSDNSYKCTTQNSCIVYIPFTSICLVSENKCEFTSIAGSYTLKASKSGYNSKEMSVTGPPDQTKEFSLDLVTYTLTVYTNEQDVSVSTNTGSSCITNWSKSCSLTLSTGDYTITATKSGWIKEEQTVKIPDKSSITLNLLKEMSLSLELNPYIVNQDGCTETKTIISDLHQNTNIIINAYSGTINYWWKNQIASQSNTFQICLPEIALPGNYVVEAKVKSSEQEVIKTKPLLVLKKPMESSMSLEDVKTKYCLTTENGVDCPEQSMGTQNKVWGGDKVVLKYNLNNVAYCSNSLCEYDIFIVTKIAGKEYPTERLRGYSKDFSTIQTIELPKDIRASKIEAEVRNFKTDEKTYPSINLEMVPDEQPYITDVSLCEALLNNETGECQVPINIKEESRWPWGVFKVSDQIKSGKPFAVFFRIGGLHKYERSFGLVEPSVQLQGSGLWWAGKYYSNIFPVDSGLQNPAVIWVLNVEGEGEKDLVIKLTDPSDSQQVESKIILTMVKPQIWEKVNTPFQFISGSENELEDSSALIKEAQGEISNLLQSNTLSSEEQEMAKTALTSVTMLTEFINSYSETTIIHGGQFNDTSSWLGTVGNGIAAFGSAIGNFVVNIPGYIASGIDAAIDFVKNTPQHIVSIGQSIDNFLADPIGNVGRAFNGIIDAVKGGVQWAFDHPFETLAIIGMIGLALTGVGAIASAAGLSALAGLGSVGSALMVAEVAGAVAVTAYKVGTNSLTGTDLLMAGLAVGPAAVGVAFRVTGAGAKLSSSLSSAFSKLNKGLSSNRVTKAVNGMMAKMKRGLGSAAKKGASGIDDIGKATGGNLGRIRKMFQSHIEDYQYFSGIKKNLEEYGVKVTKSDERIFQESIAANADVKAFYDTSTRELVYGSNTKTADFFHELRHFSQHREMGFEVVRNQVTQIRMEIDAYSYELKNSKYFGYPTKEINEINGQLKYLNDELKILTGE